MGKKRLTNFFRQKREVKRSLAFDPTPKKAQAPGRENGLVNRPGAVVADGPKKNLGPKPAVAAPRVPDESFALNFSTFIEAKKPSTLDMTLSPASFDLSDLPQSSSESDDEADVSNVVGGITATTFVLENKVRPEPVQKMAAAREEAVRQRVESETQLKEVEEKVRRLRDEMDKKYVPAAEAIDVVVPALPTIVAEQKGKEKLAAAQHLARIQTAATLKVTPAAAVEFRSAASTTDLQQLRREPLDEETKRARMQSLRAMAGATSVRHSEPFLPVHHPIEGTDPKARMKSRPQKLKMLRAVSKLDQFDTGLSTSTIEAGMSLKSPSAVVAKPKVSAAGTINHFQWPGDEEDAGAGSYSAPVTSSDESEEAVAGASALFRRIEPANGVVAVSEVPVIVEAVAPVAVKKDVEEEEQESEPSESMDADMVDQTTMDQTQSTFVAPLFVAPKVATGKSAAALLEHQADRAFVAAESMEQLDLVTSDAKLAGLFGEHLKGAREDAMLRVLDDLRELSDLRTKQERLSLARSIFQMYFAESAARENSIAKTIVGDELRAAVKAKIRAEVCDASLFAPIEASIKKHLATTEIPKFVSCDLYKTLGQKKAKARSKKPSVQSAFEPVASAPIVSVAAPVTAADVIFCIVKAPIKPLSAQDEEEEDEIDEEEESSDASPAPKAVVAAPKIAPVAVKAAVPIAKAAAVAKAVAAPAPVAIPTAAVAKVVVAAPKAAAAAKVVVAQPKAAAPAKSVVVAPAPTVANVAAPTESECNTTMESILSDPEELETFLSFVESNDKKAAQKANANVAFLLKVSQFNKAEESERPKVARTIYDAYLASPSSGDKKSRRDQKGQVEVDVSELRKRQLVSRFVSVLEQPPSAAAAAELKKGFFDKAAKDVEAFVEPELTKYNAAKKSGSVIRKPAAVAASAPVATRVEAPLAVTAPVAKSKPVVAAAVSAPVVVAAAAAPVQAAVVAAPRSRAVSVPAGLTLAELFEKGGEALPAFIAFANDIGRMAPALFLESVIKFKAIENAADRTAAASVIMNSFVHTSGEHSLVIADHVRSGPVGRWGIFAKRNLIKADFFDSVCGEVVKQLEADTWPRFVADASKAAAEKPMQSQEHKEEMSASSVLSESSHLEEDDSLFCFGPTLQRGEIQAEMLRRLREENDNRDDDSDSGFEDSPDAPAPAPAQRSASLTVRGNREFDISPSTAADLLNRLESTIDDNGASADTVVLAKKKATVRSAKVLFKDDVQVTAMGSSRPQATIPVQRSASAAEPEPLLIKRLVSGVWPSRDAKLMYGESFEGKKQSRFVVLKNKSLYIWKSESDYRKNREPSRVLDMDNLLRLTIVRDQTHAIGAPKWNLRLNFDGLNHVVILGSDLQQQLQDWKGALLGSAPHISEQTL